MIDFFITVRRSIFPTVFISGLVLTTGFSTIAQAQVTLTTESRLGTNGIGPVLTGMTLKEAIEASGLRFRTSAAGAAGNGSCRDVHPIGGPKDLSFMMNDGSIAVANVFNPAIKTLRGAQIGDSESKIRSMYPGQLKPAESVSGRTKVLQFVPKDAEDRNYRIVFSFRQGKLVNFRSGRLPEVLWIEGCF
jgi:hypothetical protein